MRFLGKQELGSTYAKLLLDLEDMSIKTKMSNGDVSPEKMYGLVKTHKVDNLVRVIASGCRTTVENLSFFIEKCLFPEVLKTESRAQNTSKMLSFIDFLNDENI